MRKRTVFDSRGEVAVQRPLAGRGFLSTASATETGLAHNTQQQSWRACSRARLRDRHS